ncbi:hypothetical protein BHE74_00058628, partial [Ensete ventricosum]
LVGVGAPDVTLPTLKWVVDRTLNLTSGDTPGMINSYGRLLSVRTERSIAARPDRVVQRRDMPFLINASQRGFDCCGGQVIAFPPRLGLRQLDLDAVVDC